MRIFRPQSFLILTASVERTALIFPPQEGDPLTDSEKRKSKKTRERFPQARAKELQHSMCTYQHQRSNIRV